MANINEERIGQYTIHKNEPLGKGAQGIVYLATSARDMGQYAAKVVKKTPQNESEARLLLQASLASKNVISIYDVLSNAENIYIIMELCRMNLGDFLRPYYGFLVESLAQYYFVQLIAGLREIHKQGIIHRDVKLENVFVASNVLKIGDFGFATTEKRFNKPIGTPNYMCPEMLSAALLQAKGSMYGSDSEFGPEVDVWASAIVLYRVIYGEFPSAKGTQNSSSLMESLEKTAEFWANTPTEGLFANRKISLSAELKDLLTKMLFKEPSLRIKSFDKVLTHPWVAQGFLKYNQELGTLKSYFNNLQESFPSAMFRSTFDGNIGQSRSLIKTYFAIKSYLQRKIDRTAYFTELIDKSKTLLAELLLASGLPRNRAYLPTIQSFAIFHLLVLQKQIGFLLSHNRYLSDFDTLCIKISQSPVVIEEIINKVCKIEFDNLKRDIKNQIEEKIRHYQREFDAVKSVFRFGIKPKEMRLIDIDFNNLAPLKDTYNLYYEGVIKAFAGKDFLMHFGNLALKIKTFIVYAYKFQNNKSKKSIEELLVEIDLLKEYEHENYFDMIHAGKKTASDPPITIGSKRAGSMVSELFKFKYLCPLFGLLLALLIAMFLTKSAHK